MRRLLLITCLFYPLSQTSFAETAQEKGLAIVTEADKRDQGWGDIDSKMKMILRNAEGEESIRKMRSKAFEMPNDGDKTMFIFDRPLDIRGTALLTWSHKTKADEQWIFLPALKRVKRIASKNKSGPFMGSEFAYEDLASQEIEKYTYKYLRDESLNGQDCFVIERYPTDKNSGYKRQVMWVDKAHYRPQKTIFYDRKDSLLKELIFSEYKEYLGHIWRANIMTMTNSQTNKSTVLQWDSYKMNTGLKESYFTRNALKRAK